MRQHPAAADQLESAEAFSSVLKKTWSSVLDAQEHWNFTYGRLIPRLDLPRDPSRIPLVSVLFNIDPPMAKVKFNGLKHRFVTGPRYYFQYDLGFNLVEDEDTILVECDYNRNLFDGDVVQCWVAGYQALLEAVVQNPDQPVSRLPMMNEQEPERRWADTGDTEPFGGAGRHHSCPVRSPGGALTGGRWPYCDAGRSLTYRELDQRSNRLGNHLQALGVVPGNRGGGLCWKGPLTCRWRCWPFSRPAAPMS